MNAQTHDAYLAIIDDAEARLAALEAALAALCQVCDGPLDNPAWSGVLAQAKRVLEATDDRTA
jgi:hypothetical protein